MGDGAWMAAFGSSVVGRNLGGDGVIATPSLIDLLSTLGRSVVDELLPIEPKTLTVGVSGPIEYYADLIMPSSTDGISPVRRLIDLATAASKSTGADLDAADPAMIAPSWLVERLFSLSGELAADLVEFLLDRQNREDILKRGRLVTRAMLALASAEFTGVQLQRVKPNSSADAAWLDAAFAGVTGDVVVVHPTFEPVAGRCGRIATRGIAFASMPVTGAARRAVVPSTSGWSIVSFDIVAADVCSVVSMDETLTTLYADAVDLHERTAQLIGGRWTRDRATAKEAFFVLGYGGWAGTLSTSGRLTLVEADDVLTRLSDAAPGIRTLGQTLADNVRDGTLLTAHGDIVLRDEERGRSGVALALHAQARTALVAKALLVEVERLGFRPLFVVHDEVVAEAPDVALINIEQRNVWERLGVAMDQALGISERLFNVTVKVGSSYGDLRTIKKMKTEEEVIVNDNISR